MNILQRDVFAFSLLILALVILPATSLAAGKTTRVSLASDGSHANDYNSFPALSADGRYVAFYSAADNLVPGDTNGVIDTFVHDRVNRETTRISLASDCSQGISDSWNPVISADGRLVAFQSWANNLVPGGSNGALDIFVAFQQQRCKKLR